MLRNTITRIGVRLRSSKLNGFHSSQKQLVAIGSRKLSNRAKNTPATNKVNNDQHFEDSFFTRLAGSDWGDRRGQAISFSMKLYWSIFAVVILNGVYTYSTDNDEDYLMLKIQRFIDSFSSKESDDSLSSDHQEESIEKEKESTVQSSNDDAIQSLGQGCNVKTNACQSMDTNKNSAQNKPQLDFSSNEPSKYTPSFISTSASQSPSIVTGPVANQCGAAINGSIEDPYVKNIKSKSKTSLLNELNLLRDCEEKLKRELKLGSFRSTELIKEELKTIENRKIECKKCIKGV